MESDVRWRESPRHAVAMACRVLAAQGQSDMVWGHVAMRDDAGRGVWIKAHLRGFEEVTVDDVLLIDWDGKVLEGEGRRHGEFPIHTEIMAARPDVNFTVHTHSLRAVAFAATDQPLRPISHDGCLFVPPDVPRFTKTSDLISTKALGIDLAQCLGERSAVLLPGHGMVTAGAAVGAAVMAAVLLDRACATQLLAGEVRRWSPDEEALAKRSHLAILDGEMGWDYLVRSTIRAGSDPFAG